MANNLIINRLFTIASFQMLVNNLDTSVYSTIKRKYIDASMPYTNAEIISTIYEYMRQTYRNQYYYKNTILNKLLLGVHSINTTTALTEIPISTSKADFVLINGKAVVYEIKTELDNLDRLDGQIQNYYKAFDHVCVVTCDEYAKVLLDKFRDTSIGIYVLSKKETIKRLKEPVKYTSKLNANEIFKILNKSEYEKIIKSYYGELPKVTQVKFWNTCRSLFNNIPLSCSYKMFLKILKERNKVSNKKMFNDVPYELKALVYFSQYQESDYSKLKNFLSLEIGG